MDSEIQATGILNHNSIFVLRFLYRGQVGITQSALQLGKGTLRGNDCIVFSADMTVGERTLPDQVKMSIKEMTRVLLKEFMSIYPSQRNYPTLRSLFLQVY